VSITCPLQIGRLIEHADTLEKKSRRRRLRPARRRRGLCGQCSPDELGSSDHRRGERGDHSMRRRQIARPREREPTCKTRASRGRVHMGWACGPRPHLVARRARLQGVGPYRSIFRTMTLKSHRAERKGRGRRTSRERGVCSGTSHPTERPAGAKRTSAVRAPAPPDTHAGGKLTVRQKEDFGRRFSRR